jgi:diguanylate cyclase
LIARLYSNPVIVSCIVFVISSLFGEYVPRLSVDQEREILRGQAIAKASTIRASVEAELNATIYLASGLSGYLSLEPELNKENVTRVLETLYGHGRYIRNIGVAPDNQLDYVYPLAGNEAAIGLRYDEIPLQWPAVKRAIEERRTVVVGPITLVQGGYGIITRTPVFLQDDRYWGIVSMVVDVEKLLDFGAKQHATLDVDWALRTQPDNTGQEPYTYGARELFSGTAVQQSINLPGETWDIAVALRDGWVEFMASRV